MTFTKLSLVAVLAAASASAIAQGPKSALSYDYIEAGYGQVKIDNVDLGEVTLRGYGLNVSKSLNDRIYATLSYQDVKKSDLATLAGDVDVTVSSTSVALGARFSLATETDFFAEVGGTRGSFKTSGAVAATETSNDWSGSVGVRSLLTNNVEGSLSASVVGSEWTYAAGALFHQNKKFALGVNYQTATDVSAWTAGVRYSF